MIFRSSKFLLKVLGALLVLGNMATAAPISGTISLPAGQVASGFMFISIGATDTSSGNSFNFVNVSINTGESSADFSLDDIPDDPSATWRIRYGCFENRVACHDYVLTSYYDITAPGNVSYKESDATTVSQGASNVNFEALEGITFSGSLTSPAGPAPAAGLDTQMFFSSTDFSVSETIRYTIAEGLESFDFSVAMPLDASLNYKVRYQCDPTSSSSGVCSSLFLTNGFFQSSAANNTVSSSGAAEELAGDASHANIDMTLIPGASISGTVSRIVGTSTANPVAFSIRALDQTAGAPDAFTNIEIPAGSSSQTYTLVVDPGTTSTWQLRVACNSIITSVGCEDYGRFSYYDADTPVTFTTADLNEADALAGNTPHTNINMTPLGAKSISGVIMLPDGKIAPAGGVELTVSAQEFTGGTGGSSFDSTVATIPQGATSASYSVPIADISGAEWLLNIACREFSTPLACLELAPTVTYYDVDNSPDFTTLDFDEADLLSSVNSIPNIDMTLIAAQLVSGIITLGNDRVAPPGGLVVRMTARGYIAGIHEANAFELVTVPEGLNEVAYEIGLPELGFDGWTLEIECEVNNPTPNCDGYKPKSYFSASVPGNTTSENQAQATLLDLFMPNSNVNIALLSESNELCLPIKSANGNIALICL